MSNKMKKGKQPGVVKQPKKEQAEFAAEFDVRAPEQKEEKHNASNPPVSERTAWH